MLTLYFSGALDEDSVSSWVGDYFWIHLDHRRELMRDDQCPDRSAYSFTARPREVHVRGNTVVVVGLMNNDEKTRASVDWTIINFYYLADTAFTQRLRDLSGNYVSTPRTNRVSTRFSTEIIRLENVTRLPHPRSASVNGNRLTLTFDAPMDRGLVPAAAAFTVQANGDAVSLSGANPVSVSGREVTLTLAAAVASGDAVTVSYAKPESSPLRNVVCEYAPSFTDRAATNATP